jgi:hypothetical protein
MGGTELRVVLIWVIYPTQLLRQEDSVDPLRLEGGGSRRTTHDLLLRTSCPKWPHEEVRRIFNPRFWTLIAQDDSAPLPGPLTGVRPAHRSRRGDSAARGLRESGRRVRGITSGWEPRR